MSAFETALRDVASCWPAFVPPNRVPVHQGAAELYKVSRPGGGGGDYDPSLTPYMIEPMDTLASRLFEALCFCGPAQSGKTAALIEGFTAHVVANDPGDMLITQMTQDKAREYSRKRIDRMFRNSEALRALLGPGSKDDNLHDKTFRNGMQLKIGWPTATNFASTEYRYTLGTDYDRWADNIDGEGDGFKLQGNRTRSFLSRGMNGVESSPSRPVTNPHWRPETLHEAPPVAGILGIYNRSDRRRWYWPCPHCGEFMQAEPGLGLFRLPSDDELLESIRALDIDAFVRDYCRVICPNTGCHVGAEHRDGMNRAGIWLPDGVTIDARRRLSGNPRKSSIAGFWLGGIAATYQLWPALIRTHLQALLEYALTGSELPLQTTANTDQCIPYTSRHLKEAVGTGRTPKDRATENWEQFTVPEWTRFTVTAVDVQGGKNARFIVQVHAVGEHLEQQLVARYAITESNREGYGGKAPLAPAEHAEDWDVLDKRVLQATYRTPDGREIRNKLTLVDSGGEDGVTPNAYRWWRSLKRKKLQRLAKVTKGEKKRYDWLVRETWVGGPNQTKGDVPLMLLNASMFKDMVNNGLKRQVPGPNFYHFPQPKDEEKNPDGWLLPAFFDELNAETRNPDGTYTQNAKRNEALDCAYMIRAGCLMLGADKKSFWDNPPSWALPLDQNSDVIEAEERRAERAAEAPPEPVAQPASEPPKRGVIERRSRRSSYLGG